MTASRNIQPARAGRLRLEAGDLGRTLRFLRGRARFAARPDDVWIATYPRSGTTWTVFTAWLLTSGRGYDFGHVSEVCPWYERHLSTGRRTAEDLAGLSGPRVFKTHLRPDLLPTVGRFIYVERGIEAVLPSYHRLYRDYLGDESDLATFARRMVDGELQYGRPADHVAAWRAVAGGLGVLWLRYEEMRADPVGATRAIADHLGVVVDDARLEAVVALASQDRMKAEEARFDHAGEIQDDRPLSTGRFIRSTAETAEPLSDEVKALLAAPGTPGPVRPLDLPRYLR